MRTLFPALAAIAVMAFATDASALTLHYDWNCAGSPGSTELTLNPDGTFETGEGYTGTYERGDGAGYLNFEGGCCPTYVVGLPSLSGYMECTTGDGCDVAPSCCWVTLDADGVEKTSNGLTSDGSLAQFEN